MSEITIKRMEKIDEEHMNSCNHWEDTDNKPPKDYKDNFIPFDRYVDLFHPFYSIINIPSPDMKWIKEAHKIGKITASFPSSYKESLSDLTEKITFPFAPEGYFVKTCMNSLKTGIHRTGPYKNMKMIVESMCTTTHFHSAVESKLYLLPWKDNLISDLEFRIFVYNGNITAISQQHWQRHNNTLEQMKDEDVLALAGKIISHFQSRIKPKLDILLTQSFVMDLAFLGSPTDSIAKLQPYFIEVNTWGKEYGAGSALFHWLVDEAILYSEGKRVEFRWY